MQSNIEWAISSRQKSKGPQSVVDGHQDDGLVHGSMRTVKEIATRSFGSHSQMTSYFENGRGQNFFSRNMSVLQFGFITRILAEINQNMIVVF